MGGISECVVSKSSRQGRSFLDIVCSKGVHVQSCPWLHSPALWSQTRGGWHLDR